MLSRPFVHSDLKAMYIDGTINFGQISPTPCYDDDSAHSARPKLDTMPLDVIN